MKRINRRDFVMTSAAVAAAMGAGARPAAAQACGDMVVGAWGGDYQQILENAVIAPNFRSGGTNATIAVGTELVRVTKLRAERASRRGSFDVVCLTDPDVYEMNRIGAVQGIDASLVPHTRNILDQFKTSYSIPHMFSAIVLVYVPTRGVAPPTRFADVMDPRFAGKVGLVDGLYLYMGGAAALASGEKSGAPMSGRNFLTSLKVNRPKIYPSNEAIAMALKSGDITLTWMWKARALQWKKAGIPLEFAVPAEGAIPASFDLAVPKNAPSGTCGFRIANAMLEPAVQAAFAERMGYMPTMRDTPLPPALASAVGFTQADLDRFVALDHATVSVQRPLFQEWWSKEFKVGL